MYVKFDKYTKFTFTTLGAIVHGRNFCEIHAQRVDVAKYSGRLHEIALPRHVRPRNVIAYGGDRQSRDNAFRYIDVPFDSDVSISSSISIYR